MTKGRHTRLALRRALRGRGWARGLRLGATRGETGGRLSGGLILGWVGLSLATLALADGAPMRFLDLPLGAYLAIQGAFVALVLIGVSLLRPH